VHINGNTSAALNPCVIYVRLTNHDTILSVPGIGTFVLQLFYLSTINTDNMQATNVKTNESFKFTGNWDEQSKKLKEKYSQLTDSDLKMETGKEEELLNRLSSKLGKKREEVVDIIRSGQESLDEKQPIATPSVN
jgi:hypothetical protein